MWSAGASYAQVPQKISYQGVITGSNGEHLNGKHTLEVRLYDSIVSGKLLFFETHEVELTDGLFSIQIGSVNNFPPSLTFESPYFLAVRVDNSIELPRTQFTSVPYALNAAHANIADELSSSARGVVTSINEVSGPVRIKGDSLTAITQNGNEITIRATASKIKDITSVDPAINVINSTGPSVSLGIQDGGITGNKIANGTVSSTKLEQSGAGVGQVLKWNGTYWLPANDESNAYIAGSGITIANGVISSLNGLPAGTEKSSTLRWNGTQWEENHNLLSDKSGDTRIYGSAMLGDGLGTDNILINPGAGGVRISNFSTGVLKSSSDGTITPGVVELNGQDVTGTLSVFRGGTGLNNVPAGTVLLGSGGGSLVPATLVSGPGVSISTSGRSVMISSTTGINWGLTGNIGTSPTSSFIGTADNQGLSIRTNSIERLFIDSRGLLGIGTNAPGEKLELLDGNLLISSSTTTPGELRIGGPKRGGFTSLSTGPQNTDIGYVFPSTIGRPNQVLALASVAGTKGQLSWIDAPTGTDWTLGGNGGTTPSSNFLGTTDNTPFEIHVNESGSASYGNRRVMRFEPTTVSPNIIGGYNGNYIAGTKWGSVVAGGGQAAAVNRIDGNASFIGSGIAGSITGNYGAILSGESNTIAGHNSSILSGSQNAISGSNSVILGGNNIIRGDWSTIAGGSSLILGSNSFGFSGRLPSSYVDLSGYSNIAYFGNTDLWLGNVDNTARELRFYAANSSVNYQGAFYSAFKAGAQSSNITYILPSSVGTPNQALTITNVTAGTVKLGWSSPGTNTNWSLSGNTGTSPNSSFLGTNDNSPFEIHVFDNDVTGKGSKRVARFEPTSASPNILLGYGGNMVANGAIGATILGGGYSASINTVSGDYSSVVGGAGNQIGDLASTSTSSNYSSISGGYQNDVTGSYSALVGGSSNAATGSYAFLGGGSNNSLSNDYTVIAGGSSNSALGSYASIGGGSNNIATSSYSAIPGGRNLKVGASSFGFNAGGNVDLSKMNQVAFFGDADLLLGNSDGNARELRFYSPNISSTFATSPYTSFKAAKQSLPINYVLPDALGTAGQTLTLSSISGTTATLSWNSPTSNSWNLGGNSGTTANNFLGTADNAPFEIHVFDNDASNKGSKRALRIEPTASSPNIIAGYNSNWVRSGVVGATISGGGTNANGQDAPNMSFDKFTVISGGSNNQIGNSSTSIGSSAYATIGGGQANTALGNSATISGGQLNYTSGSAATIAGGLKDSVIGSYSSILGGNVNLVRGSASVIGGGFDNEVVADEAGILTGSHNTVVGNNAVILGGTYNVAQTNSVVAGSYLKLGTNSFGFNAGSSAAITDLTSKSALAYFGNADLIVGNTDNTARGISLFGPNTSLNYSGAFSTTFKAGSQTSNIQYLLPTSAPQDNGNLLLAASGVTNAMSWSSGLVWSGSDRRLGINTTSPMHSLHSVTSSTSDESAAIFGSISEGSANQTIGVWGSTSNASSNNAGSIGILATGNGAKNANQTNAAFQLNDGQFAVGRTTETTANAAVVDGATGGTSYSAEGPSGVLEFTLGTNGNLVTSSPIANVTQNLGAITVNNRYCEKGSIVLVNVTGFADDGQAPDPRDAAFIVNADNTQSGSFMLRIKMLPVTSNSSNYSTGDKVRIGYLIVNKSK